MIAASKGFLDIMIFFQKKFKIGLISTNASDMDTYLFACAGGHLKVINYMSEYVDFDYGYNGLSNEHINDDGMTAFLLACGSGNLDLVMLMVTQFKYDINEKDFDKADGYLIASTSGHLKIMKYLEQLHKNKDDEWNIHIKDSNDNDAYLLAQHPDILRYLESKHDWDIHTLNNINEDIFLRSAENGHIENLKYLIEQHNWDINTKNSSGEDAYLVAAYGGQVKVMEYLEKYHNWDINTVNIDGENALLCAVNGSETNVIEYLVEKHNSDIHYKSPINGLNAFLAAACTGDLAMLTYLSNRSDINDEDVTTKDINENDALLIAIQSAAENDVIKYLLKMYYNYPHNFTRNNKGYDAYLLAIKEDRYDFMRYLHNAYDWDLSTTTNCGDTPLLVAAKNGNINILRHIIAHHDIDIEYKNIFGCNVYLCAAASLDIELIMYLEENDFDTTITTNNGLDAHDIAVMSYLKYDDDDDYLISYLGKRKFQNKFKLTECETHELGNDACVVCCEDFKKGDIYCKCTYNHTIHRNCYVDYLILNNSSATYKCVYCRLDVPEKSYKLS